MGQLDEMHPDENRRSIDRPAPPVSRLTLVGHVTDVTDFRENRELPGAIRRSQGT